MNNEEIFESGFVQAFIDSYYEHLTYSHYPDKDRLLYVLCETKEERKEITNEQIKNLKSTISLLGFEDLSFSYLLSGDKESIAYISENRHQFWLNRFSEELKDTIVSFDPITRSVCLFNDVTEISLECFKNELEFWRFYPSSLVPKTKDLLTIITNEVDVISLIEYDIEEFEKNGYWDIDFEDYQDYSEVSKPIELLFSLSELLANLNRLEMFREFFTHEAPAPEKIKSRAEVLSENFKAYGFYELEKIKHLSEKGKSSVIQEISRNGLPYAIAMLDYLGFISHLHKEYFEVKSKMNKEVSKWFDKDKDGRTVKGNINSLSLVSNEDKKRYTAYKYKEIVKSDYERLK